MSAVEYAVREEMGTVAQAPPVQQSAVPDPAAAGVQPDQAPVSPPGTIGQQVSVNDDEPTGKWRLGNNSWQILNLIVGDAKTLTECQQRIDAFMRLPLSINMPDFVRTAIRGMGFNIPDRGEQQVGGVSGDQQLLPTELQQQPGQGGQQQPPAQLQQAPTQPQQPQPAPVQESVHDEGGHILLCERIPIREASGSVLPTGAPATAPDVDQGQWVSMEHAGVPLKVYISPGGTITKGPAALMGANVNHIQPLPGERHMVFHPPGHIPPLADAQPTHAEHPDGSLPLKLTREQSQQALVQAVHDVGSHATQARSGQAERLNAAMAEQMARQGASAAPGGQGAQSDPRITQGGAPPPPPWSGAEGADNPMAGAHPSGAHGQHGGGLPQSQGGGKDEAEGDTDLVGAAGAGPLDDEGEDQDQGADDGVPETHRMHAFLMDHVMAGQPHLEAVGRFSQPNIVEGKLAEARTPPDQILGLAHTMHLWHPAEGAPDEKVGHLRATVTHALDRAHRAGAIGPDDHARYSQAMDGLQSWVGDHHRWPSNLEYSAALNGRRRASQLDQEEEANVPA